MALYYALLKLWLVYAGARTRSGCCRRSRSSSLFRRRASRPTTAGRTSWRAAAAVVATQPLLVRYGQELRAFTLVTLLVSAGVLGLVTGVQDNKRAAFVTGLVLLAMAVAHPIAGLTGIALLAWMAWLPRVPSQFLGPIAAIYGIIVAPLIVEIATAGPGQLGWVHGKVSSTCPR